MTTDKPTDKTTAGRALLRYLDADGYTGAAAEMLEVESRIAAIEAEAADAARAGIPLTVAGYEEHIDRLIDERTKAQDERDAALAQLATLAEAKARITQAAEGTGPAHARALWQNWLRVHADEIWQGLDSAAAQEWEQRIRAEERGLAYAELTMGPVSEEAREYVVNDWLASPDRVRELLDYWWKNGNEVLEERNSQPAASLIFRDLQRMRSQAASQPEQGESDLERRQNAARQRDRQAYYEKGRADGERAASQPAEPVE